MKNLPDFDEQIELCLNVLIDNGSIIVNDETHVYIACDATSDKSIDTIHNFIGKPVNVCGIAVHSTAMLLKYVYEFPDIAYDLLEEHPHSLLFFGHIKNVSLKATINNKMIAIYVVEDSFCKYLIATYKKPLYFVRIHKQKFKQLTHLVLASFYELEELKISRQALPIIRICENGQYIFLNKLN